VDFPDDLLIKIPEEKRTALLRVLAQDPRPAYQSDSERVYGFSFAGFTVKFTVAGEILTVTEVE
ncbi:MAG: tRNA (N6-threonylcarbamoyladenosine(37)-N6)-methyltransferase TrmO, partial [Candidatus Fimenecus sp.]